MIGGVALFVISGVSAAGKSTVARAVQERLGWEMAEGDDFHPPENVAKMAEGTPLTDADRWGWLESLAEWAADGLRGEICLVVEGAPEREASLEDGLADVLERVAAGARLKEASAEVAEITGLSKRALYEAALASRRG